MPKPASAPRLDTYLTVHEAADVLGVSSSTLRHWDRSGKLTAVRHPVNGYRLYRREELDSLLRRTAAGGTPRRKA